jgi:hypothetical protein
MNKPATADRSRDCLPCWHSRIDRIPGIPAEKLPIRCVLGKPVSMGNSCGAYEGAQGRPEVAQCRS